MPKSRWLEARRRKPYPATLRFWPLDARAMKLLSKARTVLYVLSREGGCRLPTLQNSGIPNFEVPSVSILRPCDLCCHRRLRAPRWDWQGKQKLRTPRAKEQHWKNGDRAPAD